MIFLIEKQIRIPNMHYAYPLGNALKKMALHLYSPHTDLYTTSFLLQSRPEKYARKVALLFFATPSRTK